jgi:hypothetical protein
MTTNLERTPATSALLPEGGWELSQNGDPRIATPTIQGVAQVEAPGTQGCEPDNTASVELLWVFASRTVDTAARDKKNDGLVEKGRLVPARLYIVV